MKTERAGHHRPFGRTCRAVLRIALILCIAGSGPLFAEQWKVHAISFSGNTVFTSGQLQGLMETKISRFWNKSVYSHIKLESDTATIAAAYGQKGYIDAEVRIDSIVSDSMHHRVSLLLSVVEGPQTLVSTVAVDGASPLHRVDELKKILTKHDSPYSTSAIDQDAQTISADLALRGHLYNHIRDSAVIDTAAHRASVIFTIDQGPLIFAGPFHTAGLKKVLPIVVRREAKFKEGDTLTSKSMNSLAQKLYVTGLFNYAQVKVPPESLLIAAKSRDTATEPVTATLEETKFFTIDASIGYGTYDSLRGSLQARFANLFGLGHSITSNGSYDCYELRGDATYSYPWIFSLPFNGLVTTYVQHNNITFLGLFDGIQFTLAKETAWNLSYRVWIKLERTEYLYAIQDTTGTTSLENTQSIGTDIYYDTRKNFTDTTAGAYLQLSPEFAGLGGRGTNQYYRALLDARAYLTPVKRFSVSSAVELGYAQGYGARKDSVPAQIIYNLGIEGMRPVRGYGQNDLSPGGGRMALVVNLAQVEHPIYKWIGLSAFVDGGYAWSDPSAEFSLRDLRWTVGPGIYAKTPVGQAEFDWGYRWTDKEWGSAYFSIGQAF